MSDRIELPKPTLEALAAALKAQLAKKFDVDIGKFEAIELVDWLADTMGPHFYNQGLQDAVEVFRKKFELITDAVYQAEKPAKL